MNRENESARGLSISGLSIFFIFFLLLITTTIGSGTAQGDSTTFSLPVKVGWNMLSLPVEVTGATKTMIFPAGVSHAYVYDTGYSVVDTLKMGQGFWLKFALAETIAVGGVPDSSVTITLHAGWNMIGGLSTPLPVNTILTTPGGIIASKYFGFVPDSGYRSTDTLWPGSGYWVKVSQAGTMIIQQMDDSCPSIVDYAGIIYNTVQIGKQCWLRENLNIGTMIPGAVWHSDNDTIEKYCYDNDTANCSLYGGLYLWSEAMSYSTAPGPRGICPPGWHIPRPVEYETLRVAVNDDGNALKAIGQGEGDGAGTNASGFSAMLAGDWVSTHGFDWGFGGLGLTANFWSSAAGGSLFLHYSSSWIGIEQGIYLWGYSVRCLKDFNYFPDIPAHPSPSDGATALFPSVELAWSSNDPDGDPLSFDVYLGTDNPPVTKVYSNLTSSSQLHGGMNENTTYYWKVVANADGYLTEGPVWSFTTGGPYGLPCPGTETVDYGGKTYTTVQIGSQCWLKENLNIGAMIHGTDTASNNGIIEKYCYDNDTANCTLYGGLYQWNETMQYVKTDGSQGFCPPEWHIPTLAEYQTLSSTVDGDGNALKAVGQGSGGGAGTNSSGFAALLAGTRYAGGNYNYLSFDAHFWSSTSSNGTDAHYLTFYHDNYAAQLADHPSADYGFSARCLKNYGAPPDTPSTPSPADNDTAAFGSVVLTWSCDDPDNDSLLYDVYFGTNNPPAEIVYSNLSSTAQRHSGLSPNTDYYWKIVANDGHGNLTAGPVWHFTTGTFGAPCPWMPTVDYGGKTYHTVQIINQCWLKENLDVGTMILGTDTASNNGSIEKYCYNNDTASCALYGGLYQWHEAMQYSVTPGSQGICPSGWHIPTTDEYDSLISIVNGDGDALKAVGEGAGTDVSGFSALLAGHRSSDGGGFYSAYSYAMFWSSTEFFGPQAWAQGLGRTNDWDPPIKYRINEDHGFSVRCLED